LFSRADALSVPGSLLLYDVVGTALLKAPFAAATLAFMESSSATAFQHRRTGGPHRGPGLDRRRHRYGRSRQQMQTLGAPTGSG
jgi:hypothetical protein